MILEPGTLLNSRYRIMEVLGQGGMGSVYRATDENLDIDVAVKDNLFTTDEYARQFRREATILAKLRHACLPRVTDHFIIEGQGQYLVMDYVEGEDLRQRMERIDTLPEEEVIVIGAAICDALMYLCSRTPAVIHRDIKPGNVKITPLGEIFLVDFGLAKTMQGTQATTTGARAMTPGFSPPEQYGTARTDMRTDIFSLGATLYAALTGVTPEDALARVMGQAELSPIRKHKPSVSKKVAAAVEKALELRPEDRYQTPEQFKKALLASSSASRKFGGEYVVAPPPERHNKTPSPALAMSMQKEKTPPRWADQREEDPLEVEAEEAEVSKPITLPKKRKFNWGCMAISTLIIVIAGLGATSFHQFPLIPNQILAQIQLSTNTSTPEITQTGPAGEGYPTAQADVSSISLDYTPTAIKTISPVFLSSTNTPVPTSTPLPATQIPTALPTPVGGGTGQLAYASNIAGVPQIFLINSNGTGRVQITNINEGACQPDFSPDGKRIIFISPCDSGTDYYPGASMYIINIDGTGLLPLPTMMGGDYDPAWSPDGKQIAFTSLRNNNRPHIYVLNLDDNSVKELSQKFVVEYQPTWSLDGKRILYVSDKNGKQHIWVMDADGSNPQQFSKSTNFMDSNPSWSVDGKDVLVTQYVAQGGVPRVVLAPFNLDDYVEYQIGKERRPMRNAVMSPDGYWIAFEGWEIGGKHNIYLITTTGISVNQLTDDPSMAFDPVWKPNSSP
jgi:serine/threonine protein kinase/Tol biopolymer transport system component